MGPAGVVGLKIAVQVLLHLVERLVPGRPALDPEVLFEERPVEPLDEAVRLGPADLRGAVLDLLELEEELVGVLVGPAAVLAAVVAQDRPDLYAMLLEERQRVVVQNLNGRDRHLRGVEPGPDEAAEAVQYGLDVDLADPLQRAREKGVHGHQFTSGVDLDVPLAILGVEPLQRQDLFVAQLDLPLPDRLLQPQEPVVACLEVVAHPDTPHTAGADLDPSQHQLVRDPLGAVRWMLQRVGQDRFFNRRRNAVRMRSAADCSRRSGTPSRRCRVPGRAVARTASGALTFIKIGARGQSLLKLVHTAFGHAHLVFKPGARGRRPRAPGFLKLFWSACRYACVCVCVSTPQAINNQWRDMV